MFNKYWREYPFLLQVVLLVLMLFTMGSAGYLISALLTPMLTGATLKEMVDITEESSSAVINASRLMQMLNNLVAFAIAAYLYAYASHPQPIRYLGFRKINKVLPVIVALLLTVA